MVVPLFIWSCEILNIFNLVKNFILEDFHYSAENSSGMVSLVGGISVKYPDSHWQSLWSGEEYETPILSSGLKEKNGELE